MGHHDHNFWFLKGYRIKEPRPQMLVVAGGGWRCHAMDLRIFIHRKGNQQKRRLHCRRCPTIGPCAECRLRCVPSHRQRSSYGSQVYFYFSHIKRFVSLSSHFFFVSSHFFFVSSPFHLLYIACGDVRPELNCVASFLRFSVIFWLPV